MSEFSRDLINAPPLKSPVVPATRIRTPGSAGSPKSRGVASKPKASAGSASAEGDLLEYIAVGLRWAGAWWEAHRPWPRMPEEVREFWEDRYKLSRLKALLRRKQEIWSPQEARAFLRILTAYIWYWEQDTFPEEEVSWKELRDVPIEWDDDPAPYLMDWWIQGYRYTTVSDHFIRRTPPPVWKPEWPPMPEVSAAWLPNAPWPDTAWKAFDPKPLIPVAEVGTTRTDDEIARAHAPFNQWQTTVDLAVDQASDYVWSDAAQAVWRVARAGDCPADWMTARLAWMTWCLDAYADRLVTLC